MGIKNSYIDISMQILDHYPVASISEDGALWEIKGIKYEGIKIPVLKKAYYLTWKVKMLLYLETADPDFIDRITNGPHVPKKRVPQEGTTLEHYLDKMKAEMTQEEKLEVLKDAMVKNILHNSLDVVMSNRVIACKTSK